ncbi:hypothetical protein RCIA86 [Methanocella arvoryzae MRE50]|uniref:Uncharacterized protein n=1 Tax=Methanocella arvoryzae (strain DSM 22066 / NBRC 105507 / MRE50) TaxID=351160 RepID=Q0W523_METAR|nr:hypothetical protein RCIA86 [Methanocella arvoryzae MRE50]
MPICAIRAICVLYTRDCFQSVTAQRSSTNRLENACQGRRSKGDPQQLVVPPRSSGPSLSSSLISRPPGPPSLKSLSDLRALPNLPFSMVRVRKPDDGEVSEAPKGATFTIFTKTSPNIQLL